MSRKPSRRPFQAGPHHQQTESHLLLGGFAIILVIGGALIWGIMGPVPALIAVTVIVGAGLVFVLILLLLRALDAWARSE